MACSVKQNACLIVIDGWGVTDDTHGNAILAAKTPTMDSLSLNSVLLEASETHVGVPEGQMGNSEVGHLNIGAGRIVFQDIVRINIAVRQKKLLELDTFSAACTRAKEISGGRIHLIGLVSDGGVHSHIEHMFGLIEACKDAGIEKCFLHFISDGRDTSPQSGVGFVQRTLDHMASIKYGEIKTVVGRYYAMDRDTNWDRIQIALDGMVGGKGHKCTQEEITKVINESYSKGSTGTDEFLTPIIVGSGGRIGDNDTLVLFNYRSDRMREISKALGMNISQVSGVPNNIQVYCMTQYSEDYTFPVLFKPISMKNVLAECLSLHGIKQLHVAETEKYAHVTFFFNGGVEKKFEKEDRVMVPSPKVKTYDLKPEMSCEGVGDEMVKGIECGQYPFIMCNFAPPDMVGHTGSYDATVLACAATDVQIRRVYEACEKSGYVLMITADHGNAEKMYDEKNNPHTAHTLFPVPFIITKGHKLKCPADRKPALCDVAPTVLHVMGIPQPTEMTGQSLLQ